MTIYALRQKAALFGNIAPNPNLFVNPTIPNTSTFPNLINTPLPPKTWSWINFAIQFSNAIDLDASYPKIVVGSWFVLRAGNNALLLNVTGATTIARADFALSGKVTELVPDYQPDVTKLQDTFAAPANRSLGPE